MNDSGLPKTSRWTTVAAVVLLVVGLTQMIGDLLKVPALKGLAAATNISPAPKVFTAVGGLETYSTQFFLEWTDTSGKEHSMELTPEVYRSLRGPYNRRNIYGAVLAFGPVMATDARTKPMFDAAAKYALSGNAPLLRELGIDPATVAGSVRVRYVPRAGSDMGTLPRQLEVPVQ
jgi:hypothetical protein